MHDDPTESRSVESPEDVDLPLGEPPADVERERDVTERTGDDLSPETGAGFAPARADEPASEDEPIGDDNIRDGTVGGLMGGPRQQQGQGQGG